MKDYDKDIGLLYSLVIFRCFVIRASGTCIRPVYTVHCLSVIAWSQWSGQSVYGCHNNNIIAVFQLLIFFQDAFDCDCHYMKCGKLRPTLYNNYMLIVVDPANYGMHLKRFSHIAIIYVCN